MPRTTRCVPTVQAVQSPGSGPGSVQTSSGGSEFRVQKPAPDLIGGSK